MNENKQLSEFMDFVIPQLSKHLRILKITNREANAFFRKYHYLHRIRRSKKICYAILIKGVVVGFLEFSYPIWHRRRGVIPPYKQGEVVELSRVCLLDSAPKNSESCAISKALKQIKSDWKSSTGIMPKVVVSYSDKKGQGHSGGIYKAVGFKIIGVSHRKTHRCGSMRHPHPYSSDDGKLLYAISII